MTATNGRFSNLDYRDFLVYEDVSESGTEGQAANGVGAKCDRGRGCTCSTTVKPPWDRRCPLPTREPRSTSATTMGSASWACVAGAASRASGNPISILYPRAKNGRHPIGGQERVGLLGQDDQHEHPRLEGADATVTLYESPTRFCELRPYDDRKNWQGGVEWIYKSVPLRGNPVWKLKGEVPATLNWVTIEFLSLGRRAVCRLDRRHGDQVGRRLLSFSPPPSTRHGKARASWLRQRRCLGASASRRPRRSPGAIGHVAQDTASASGPE